MAEIVLGIGTSHTPMLNVPAEDWPRFIERDWVRDFLDKEGGPRPTSSSCAGADPHLAAEITPERFAAKHAEAHGGASAQLRRALRAPSSTR